MRKTWRNDAPTGQGSLFDDMTWSDYPKSYYVAMALISGSHLNLPDHIWNLLIELCSIRPTLLWEFEKDLTDWLDQRDLEKANDILSAKINQLQKVYSDQGDF